MNSSFLDDIYEFHYKYNTKIKVFKYSIFKIIITFFIIILVSFLVSVFLLNCLTTIPYTYKLLISEILTFIALMLYINTIFKENLKKDIKYFVDYINRNTKLNISSFNEFQTYYLLLFMMQKTEYTLCKNHFDNLYQLIDLHTKNLMVFDYLSQKRLLIYTGSISLMVALLTSIFDKISLLALLIILFILFFIVILYISIGSLIENQFIKEKNNYYKLNEIIKKCEIDFILNKKIVDNLNSNSICNINNILTNFNIRKKST